MKKTLLGLLVATTGLLANTPLASVDLDIYSNQTFFNKTFKVGNAGEIVTKVPAFTTLKSLKLKPDATCTVTNSTLSDQLKSKNIEIDSLRKLQIEKNFELEALKENAKLLKSISLKDANDLTKIDEMSDYLVKNLVKNSQKINATKNDIINIGKDIKRLSSIKEEYKDLTINYTCKNQFNKLTIIYPNYNLKYEPFYNITASLDEKAVTIEKKASLFFKGVENYESANLNIYSYAYNKKVAPKPFYPNYLGKKRPISYAKAMPTLTAIKESIPTNRGIRHQELETKSFYKIENIKLNSGEKNIIDIDLEKVDATFKSVIDAYATNSAYLEASFKTTRNYNRANAQFSLEENLIGKRVLNRIKRNRLTKLYFGEDENIDIERELIKTLDENALFGTKSVSTLNWKYTITNKKQTPTDVEFIHQVPVSKDGNIKVRTLASPKFNKQNAIGKTIWDFTLQPKEEKGILFGYEVSDQN